MWMIASSAALAAPPVEFVGAADDVAVATLAWEAARECTGRDGLAEPRVEIIRRVNNGDYLGVARTNPDTGRLYRIDLNTDEARRREVLVHEVSHAWVSEGPVALVEGAAERIADCIARSRPGIAPLQFDDGRDLSGLPDLLSWSKPTESEPSELHAVRTDAYVGASRLMRTAERILPPGTVWAARSVTWEGFLGALEAEGERGVALAAVVRGGSTVQRVALADDDRDGLSAIAEGWLGTSDARWDSDGDGWWDGAQAPPGTRPVPLDGTPVCVGAGGGRAVGGDLRGAALPRVTARRAAGATLASLAGPVPIGSTGGLWVSEAGASGPCASSLRVTVWAEDPAFAPIVAPLHDAIAQAIADSEARWDEGPQRVAVGLGGATTGVVDDVVWVSSDEVLALISAGGPAAVARTAVAARRLWVQGDRDWMAVEAVARSLGQ